MTSHINKQETDLLPVNTIVDVLVYVEKQHKILAWSLQTPGAVGDGVIVPYKENYVNGVIVKKSEKTIKTKPIHKTLGKHASPWIIKKIEKIAEKYGCDLESFYKLVVPHQYYGCKFSDTHINLKPPSGAVAKNTEILNIIQPIEHKIEDTTIEYIRTYYKNGQTLIILPSIYSIEKLEAKLPNYLKTQTVRLDKTGNYSEILTFVKNEKKIALGTRNNVLQYTPNLKTIILVEPEHPGHELMTKPYLNSKILLKERLETTGCSLLYISSNPGVGVLTKNVKTIEKPYKGYNVKLVDLTELPYSERTNPKTILSEIRRKTNSNKTVALGYYSTGSSKISKLGLNLGSEKIEKTKKYDIIILEHIDKIIEKPSLKPGYEIRKNINTALNSLDETGLLIIVTTYKNHPILQSYVTKNHTTGLVWQHKQAKKYNLPPYGKIITIESKNKTQLKNLKPGIHGGLTQNGKKTYLGIVPNNEYQEYIQSFQHTRNTTIKIQ